MKGSLHEEQSVAETEPSPEKQNYQRKVLDPQLINLLINFLIKQLITNSIIRARRDVVKFALFFPVRLTV